MAQDSIVIDGVMLDVEAQVRFDSLPTDSRNTTATFQAAWTFNTFLGGGRSAPGCGTGVVDPTSIFNVRLSCCGFPHSWIAANAANGKGTLMPVSDCLVGFHRCFHFPDSLIGFLPATATDPLRMVTSQQFDIGTEQIPSMQ